MEELIHDPLNSMWNLEEMNTALHVLGNNGYVLRSKISRYLVIWLQCKKMEKLRQCPLFYSNFEKAMQVRSVKKKSTGEQKCPSIALYFQEHIQAIVLRYAMWGWRCDPYHRRAPMGRRCRTNKALMATIGAVEEVLSPRLFLASMHSFVSLEEQVKRHGWHCSLWWRQVQCPQTATPNLTSSSGVICLSMLWCFYSVYIAISWLYLSLIIKIAQTIALKLRLFIHVFI